MEPIVLTRSLASRIDEAVVRASISRVTHIRELSTNPLEISFRRWNHVTGALVRRGFWYYHYFNALGSVRAGDEAIVDEALTWYRENGIAVRIGLTPFAADPALLAHLARRGLRQAQFMSTLYGYPEGGTHPPPADVTIERYRPPDLAPFVDYLIDGVAERDPDILRMISSAEFADWDCYVAFTAGKAVAAAAMYVWGNTAVLASGSTRPAYRGKGIQTTLLRRRLEDAAAQGCDLVVSQATPGTTSQRNMERVGMRTAYTQAVWGDDPANAAREA